MLRGKWSVFGEPVRKEEEEGRDPDASVEEPGAPGVPR